MRSHAMTRSGRRWLVCLILPAAFAAVLAGLLALQESSVAASEGHEEAVESLQPYLEMLNEFSERRRLNAYFVNEQSASYGVQVGFVNLGAGNLTFLRRDLVTAGRIPLVLARVYDSSLGAEDFGPGWRLSAAESVRPSGETFLYVDESASHWRLRAEEGELHLDPPLPSDLESFRVLRKGRLRLQLKGGLTKTFRLQEGIYLLTRVEDRNGNAVRLIYREGLLARMEGGNGRFIELERDAGGRVIRAGDDQGRSVSYGYDGLGRLEKAHDLAGNAWSYVYDDRSRLSRALDPQRNESLSASFNSAGRATDVRTSASSYSFEYRGAETWVIDMSGRRSLFRHSGPGVTVAVENALGGTTNLELDSSNRVRRILSEGTTVRTMGYDRARRLAWVAEGKGGRREHTYDHDGRLIKVRSRGRSGSSTLAALSYDKRGNLISRRGEEGENHYRYSEQGDVIEASLWDGSYYRFEYDGDGQIAALTDARGNRTEFTYHADGKLAEAAFADGSRNWYAYDALGVRTRTEFLYRDGERGSVQYVHDSLGSITEILVTNPDGSLSGNRMTLDARQRLSSIEYIGGRSFGFDYDEEGNLLASRAIDGRGEESIAFEYDALNRLESVRTVKGQVLRYEYAPGEADLRLQSDLKTAPSQSPRTTAGATFGSSWEIVRSRRRGSHFGTAAFDSSSMAFVPLGREVLHYPDEALLQSWTRMRLTELDRPDYQQSFEQPSSVFFWPAEYSSLNCCFACTLIYGVPCFCDYFEDPLNPVEECPNCVPLWIPPPCSVSAIQYHDPDQGWKTISSTLHVLKGTTVSFRALKSTSGAWPAGKPAWGGAASGSGVTKSVTFNGSTGNHTVTASCDNTKSVTVRVYTLQVDWDPVDNFQGRSPTRLGLGEHVDLDFRTTPSGITPVQIGNLRWKKTSGGGTLNAHATNGTAVFMSPATAGTTNLKLEIQSGPSKGKGPEISRSIIAPTNATLEKEPGTGIWHIQGRASVGFKGRIHFLPRDVSFFELEFREGSAPAIGAGYFAPLNGALHPTGNWALTLGANLAKGTPVMTLDTIEHEGGPPYSNGSLRWNIPWQYRVAGTTTVRTLTTATHQSDITAAGRCTITKKGAGPFSKNLLDPSSNY